MNSAETLQQLALLCRSGRAEAAPPAVEPSGSAQLDALLPGGGWQAGTIVELMPGRTGIGELRLLMPALARMTGAGRHVALIAPPFIPFAPALAQHEIRLERLLVIRADNTADILWACEQTLRCRSFGAALAWPVAQHRDAQHRDVRDRDVRRLQLAAAAGGSIGFLYRPPAAARESSPAAVRLRLQADSTGGLRIDVIKCRGTRSGMQITAGA